MSRQYFSRVFSKTPKRSASLLQRDWADGICAIEEFLALIDDERARTDRTGSTFSIVAFETIVNEKTLQRFLHILNQRLRSTDELGWLDAQSIGMILPYTHPTKAQKLASELLHALDVGNRSLRFRIMTYPFDWLSEFKKCSPEKALPNPGNQIADPPRMIGEVEELRHSENSLQTLYSPPKRYYPLWKRAMDITGAATGLVLLSPLFLLIAALIKTVSPGPVFFKQERVGYLGNPFTLIKFRTMRKEADPSIHQQHLYYLINSDQPLKKLDERYDPRLIPAGKFLRRLGLDELPQLINVLLGEMSLVGPRPCILYEAKEFQQWQSKRCETMPGLTGLWQVNGKNRTTLSEMMRFDIQYSKQRSFLLDLKILLKTFPAILSQAIHSTK